MSLPKAVRYTIESDMRAVTVLTINGFDTHALSLVFSSIDKMAWLCSADTDSTRKDFLGWMDQYFMPGNTTTLSAIDLYAARCGFLHSGSAESKLYRDGKAKQIFYSTGPLRAQSEVENEIFTKLPEIGIRPDDTVIVQCVELLGLWSAAINRFTDAIESDVTLRALVERKAALQLAIYPAD